jgi:hypothetical protein
MLYTKYENNPFKIVVCSLQKPNSSGDGVQDQNQSIPDFVGYTNIVHIPVDVMKVQLKKNLGAT